MNSALTAVLVAMILSAISLGFSSAKILEGLLYAKILEPQTKFVPISVQPACCCCGPSPNQD